MSLNLPRNFSEAIRSAFREWHQAWGHVYPHEGAGANDHAHPGTLIADDDITGADWDDLTDGGESTLHTHPAAGGGTLDQAYDFGGAGAGRTVNTTDGAVLLQTTEADAAPNLDLRRAVADIAKAILEIGVNADANPYFRQAANGTQSWGPGGGTPVDTALSRDGVAGLRLGTPGGAAGYFKIAELREDGANGRTTLTDGAIIKTMLNMAQTLATISAGGVLTVTNPTMVAAAASGTADDLDSFSLSGMAGAAGDVFFVRADSGDTITIRDAGVSGGNIQTFGGTAITLDAVEKIAIVMFDGTATFYAAALGATAASLTAAGVVEIATAAETTTGTDATRAVSPDGLAGSDYGKRVIGVLLGTAGGDALTTGDSKAHFRIPSVMNGWSLVAVSGCVTTVSSSGAVTVMIHKSSRTNATTRAASVDMLTTALTIDVSEFDSSDAAAAAPKSDGSEDVVTGDFIHIDVDAAGTGVKGLYVETVWQLP